MSAVTADNIRNRRQKLEQFMIEEEMDLLYISGEANLKYLSGAMIDTGRICVKDGRWTLFTDSRYTTQAEEEGVEIDVKKVDNDFTYTDALASFIQGEEPIRVGFEAEETSCAQMQLYVPDDDHPQLGRIDWIPADEILGRVRMIKDEQEIEAMRRAADIGSEAIEEVIAKLHAGMTELEVAAEIEYAMKKRGATDTSFSTIAVSGANSAKPHGQPSEKVLEPGDMLTMDFGCIYRGYCSDMTRTVMIGEGTEKHKEIYDIVLQAQLEAMKLIRPGAVCRDVDAAARDLITERGYGEYFGHGLGHSLGLYIHEEPRFSPMCDEVLQPGMVLSVEPGIYLPGEFGVRIEDVILVTEDGYENLSKAPKDYVEVK